jgi:hypothetical protein
MASTAQHYLEGVMFFPYLFDVKDKFDRFSVALALEGDQVGHAKKLGLKVKQEEGKMDTVRISQKPYNNKYGTGVTTFMNAVKITEAIEYNPEGGSSFADTKKDDLNDDVPF